MEGIISVKLVLNVGRKHDSLFLIARVVSIIGQQKIDAILGSTSRLSYASKDRLKQCSISLFPGFVLCAVLWNIYHRFWKCMAICKSSFILFQALATTVDFFRSNYLFITCVLHRRSGLSDGLISRHNRHIVDAFSSSRIPF